MISNVRPIAALELPDQPIVAETTVQSPFHYCFASTWLFQKSLGS